MAVDIIEAVHVSPHCIRVDFNGQMRNNASLQDATNYQVRDATLALSCTVAAVYVPTAQSQPFVGPSADGGAPESVYVVTSEALYAQLGGTARVDIDAVSAVTDPIDYYDGLVLGTSFIAVTAVFQPIEQTYGTASGIRTDETFRELSSLGRAKWKPEQEWNYGMAQVIGKLADQASGGLLTTLQTAIDGELATEVDIPSAMSPGGFALPDPDVPELGETITLGEIPSHVDRLWGPCDGDNTLFRTSIQYDPFTCAVFSVPNRLGTDRGGELEAVEWFAPGSGNDRLLRLASAPQYGSSLLAVYKPRQTLYRVNHEILGCTDIDASANTAIVAGRKQLCSTLEPHAVGAVVEDVWATSSVGRARYSLFAFGAHGRPLEYIAHDRGVPHSANPSLSFTELRRAVFNTSSQMRGTYGTVLQAIRYIYPDLWPFIMIDEDPRWPDCWTVWYSSEAIGEIGGSWVTAPEVEVWETWLDHVAYVDGFPTDTYYDTYWRSPSTDVSYDGDYLLASGSEDPEIWPFPVVVSGPEVHMLGTPAPELPPPSWDSSDYLNYLVRPSALDRVLSAGVGLLLLDYRWANG